MARRLPVLLSLTAVLLGPRWAMGQEGRWAMLREDGKNLFADTWHIWKAPIRADAGDVAGFAGVVGSLVLIGLFDDEIQDWFRDNPESLPVRALGPMRDPRPASSMGYTKTLVAISGGVYLFGLATRSDGLRAAGMGCMTADLSNTFARHLLARLLGRKRPQFTRDPYVFRPFAWGDWTMRSFPGGHVANMMACSAFLSNHFDLGVLGILMYAVSTAVGLGRVADEAHWTTDTAFGMVFGWAVGRAVAGRFAGRDGSGPDPALDLVPAASAPAITLTWRIPF